METYELLFEIEPVAWSRPRVARSGHMFNAPKMRLAQEQLRYLMKSQFKRSPLDGALKVGIVFTLTPPKRLTRRVPSVKPDIDNLIKLVTDAGNEILWVDDNLIVEISARKEYGKPSIKLVLGEV